MREWDGFKVLSNPNHPMIQNSSSMEGKAGGVKGEERSRSGLGLFSKENQDGIFLSKHFPVPCKFRSLTHQNLTAFNQFLGDSRVPRELKEICPILGIPPGLFDLQRPIKMKTRSSISSISTGIKIPENSP